MFLPVPSVCNGFIAVRTIKVKAFYNPPLSLLPVALKVTQVFSSVVTEITRILSDQLIILHEIPL